MPYWASYAFGAALLIASIPLIQEKFKADALALAFWIKVFMTTMAIPFVLHYGLPHDPWFYLYVGLTCIIYSFSDVIYYRAVPLIGSGMMTRLLPAGVIATFFLWFAVDPALAKTYLAQPNKAAAIGAVLALFVYCMTHLRKCHFSWNALRQIWFVIFAASIGAVFTKLSFAHSDAAMGPYAYVFFQSLVMMVIYLGFFAVKKPLPRTVLLSRNTMTAGLILSVVGFVSGLLKAKAIQLVDNPAFVSMVLFTDCLWVLLIYKLLRRKEQANIVAGLGIVACAVLIVLIKNWH